MSKKIVVISNKKNLKRNYSKFIESCDVVCRSGKLDNIESGLTGSRIDIALIPVHQRQAAFSRAEQHLDILKERCRHICFFEEPSVIQSVRKFIEDEKLREIPGMNVEFIPSEFIKKYAGHFFTTTIVLSTWMIENNPDAEVYFLGDLGTFTRTILPNGCSAVPEKLIMKETKFVRDLISKGKIIPILEDNKPDSQCKYSTRK